MSGDAPFKTRGQINLYVAKKVVGKRIDDAIVAVELCNLRTRTVSTDGHMHAIKRDFREDRVNFTVVRGIVQKAEIG